MLDGGFIFLTKLFSINIEQNIFQTIGLALLTIFIPLAIFLFEFERDEFKILDRNVILDHILKAKLFLVFLFLMFFPLLFWNISPLWGRIIEFFLWAAGVYFFVRILIKSYTWVKGERFHLRFDYLKSLRNKPDIADSWASVWKVKRINPSNELDFLEIFFSVIEDLLKDSKQIRYILSLLDDFQINMYNRSIYSLVREEKIFSKILKIYFSIWEKNKKKIDKKEKREEPNYNWLLPTMFSIMTNIQERALKDSWATYFFFENLKKHIDKYQEKVAGEQKQHIYLQDFLTNIFCPVFFENIANSPKQISIWSDNFPKNWKITTKSNLKNKNEPSTIIFYSFLGWAQDRIRNQNKGDYYDKEMSNILKNLFPEVEPVLWARILIFYLLQHLLSGSEKRIGNIIEHPWPFGYNERGVFLSGYSIENKEEFDKKIEKATRKQEENEKKNTFELTYLFFPLTFSKENVEKYIKNLKELNYPKDSKEEIKRNVLLDLFQRMLDFLNGLGNSGSKK